MYRRLLVLSLVAVATACGGEETSCEEEACVDASLAEDAAEVRDAGAADAEPPEIGPPDSGPPDIGHFDVGQSFAEASCASATPRTPDGACSAPCPSGGLCVSTQQETFCVDRCDEDLSRCLDGFGCVDIGANDPTFVCVPPIGSCLQESVTFGTSCAGGAGNCAPAREICQGDLYGVGYCTDSCADDGVCPEGYHCGMGDEDIQVCLADFIAPTEACATEARTDELPCRWDGDCGPDSRCVPGAPGQTGVCAALTASCDACEPPSACRVLGSETVCVPQRCACRGELPGVDRDLMAEALSALGLDRCSATLESHDWVMLASDVLGDPYRLSWTNALISESWRGPEFTRDVVQALDRAASASSGPAERAALILEEMARRADHPATVLTTNPTDPTTPLVTAMVDLIAATGGAADVQALMADTADLPPDLREAVAGIVVAIHQAHDARQRAFANISDVSIPNLYRYGPAFVVPNASGAGLDPTDQSTKDTFNTLIDYSELFGGGVHLMRAIDAARLDRFAVEVSGPVQTSTATFLFSQLTPIGRIAIGDSGSGLYDESLVGFDGPWALLIDVGGHDDYRIAAGGNSRATNTVSVLIDLAGDDRYGYLELPDPLDVAPRLVSDRAGRYSGIGAPPISLSDDARQGAGRAGVGLLIDLGGGSDHYQSLRMSQGVGMFGVGALVDDGGDDVYLAEQLAQGAGMFGLGLLLDLSGHDVRTAFQAAQGFGFARGVGVLYDVDGNDEYLMDTGDPALGGDPLYPSAQRPESTNASLGQGFGFGRRADATDRAFMSGGLGVLCDAAGDDRYEGSVFAQGAGFWFGAGILADQSGNDRYDGLWYAMASGAHMAFGALVDGDGNDEYGLGLRPINITIAGAHDFSTAYLIDEHGDDRYFGSRISFGGGNSAGRAFFIENEGNDDYQVLSAYSYGAAGLVDTAENFEGAPKRKVDSVGVFIDAGGTDSYQQPDPKAAMNDAMWLQPQSMDPGIAAVELGVGLDDSGETTVHAPW